jgi:hypothetical protein
VLNLNDKVIAERAMLNLNDKVFAEQPVLNLNEKVSDALHNQVSLTSGAEPQ